MNAFYPRPLGAPVYDGQSPLGKLVSPNQRGKLVTLRAPVGVAADEEGRRVGHPITAFDLMTGIDCVVGEWLEATLGIALSPTTPQRAEDLLVVGGVVVQIRAVVTYGLGSAPQKVECDWIQGTGFPVSADTLGIEARYVLQTDPGEGLPQGWTPPTYDVAAGIGRGGETPNSNSARLTEIRYLAPQETKRIRIPSKAVSVVVVPLAASGTVTTTMRAFGSLYAATYAVTAPLTGYQVENSFPIWNGAEFLEIANSESETPLRVACVFGLKL